MVRLIDADALTHTIGIRLYTGETMEFVSKEDIDAQSTIDAVSVIRCEDCKYFEYDHFDAVYFPTETGEAERVPLITAHEICTRWGDGCKTSENGYCFMAERKEE